MGRTKLTKKSWTNKKGQQVEKIIIRGGTSEQRANTVDNNVKLTKNQLKAREISANKQVSLANSAMHQANVANITTQIGSTARQLIGNNWSNDNSSAVNQAITGGSTTTSNQRDDDKVNSGEDFGI